MGEPTEGMTEAELSDHYDRTRDTSEFRNGPEPITVRRNVTISVRFSEAEIAELRSRAGEAGAKVTSFIRAAAMESANPVDLAALGELARDLEKQAHEVAEIVKHGGVA